MNFPDEIWNIIKDNMFHNIQKHGKHLKKDKHIIKYNDVLKTIPHPVIVSTGPRIIYTSSSKETRFVKFIYHIIHKRIHKSLIEYIILPDNYPRYNKIYDIGLRNYYYYQYQYT